MGRWRPAAVLALLIVLAGIGGCTDDNEPPTPPQRHLDVVVNIFPLRWLAERIGGDLVSVRTIEAEPHEQGPAASQGNPLSQQDKDLVAQADANLFAGNMSSDLRKTL